MAEINTTAELRLRKGFSHTKRAALRIDMTPMVDLGFLLITFFVFTTNLSQPAAMNLVMPSDKIPVTQPTLPQSLALSVLLGNNNKLYYYHGNWDDAKKSNAVFKTSYSIYSGLGEVIRQKQKAIDASGKFPEGRSGLMLLIKPTSLAAYKNVVDVLDEVLINDVKKYAVVDPLPEETGYLKKRFN